MQKYKGKVSIEVSEDHGYERFWLTITTPCSKQDAKDLQSLLNEILKEEKCCNKCLEIVTIWNVSKKYCKDEYCSCHQPTNSQPEEEERCCINCNDEGQCKKAGQCGCHKDYVYRGIPKECIHGSTGRCEKCLGDEPLTKPQKPTKRPDEMVQNIIEDVARQVSDAEDEGFKKGYRWLAEIVLGELGYHGLHEMRIELIKFLSDKEKEVENKKDELHSQGKL